MKTKHINEVSLELRGGLGNQLFGLAAGWFIASSLNKNLLLDGRFIKWHGSNASRSLELNKFKLSIPGQNLKFRDSLFGFERIPMLRQAILRLIHFFSLFKKYGIHSDSWADRSLIISSANSNQKISGAFLDFEWAINCKNYGFPRKLELMQCSNAVQDFKERVWSTCAIHIRLTDYLNYPDVFPYLTGSYYESAVSVMKSQGFEKFSLFTDDLAMAKEKYPSIFDLPDLCVIPNSFDAAETFFLMESCGGVICASSSFSSWAAFFVASQGGKVVVPDLHLLDGSKDPRPAEWLRLDSDSGGLKS